MARLLKNSRISPSNGLDSEDVKGRAALRANIIAQATKATTGAAGLAEGDDAKRSIERPLPEDRN